MNVRTNLTHQEDNALSKKGLCPYTDGTPAATLATKIEHFTLADMYALGVWRPEDSYAVLTQMAQGTSILIEGSAGCGKGAVLTGVWQALRALEINHLWYDCHYRTTKPEELTDVLAAQVAVNGIILIDSMDYLYAGVRKIRKVSKEAHAQKLAAIFPYLYRSPLIVGTIHEPSWAQLLGDLDIILGSFRDLISTHRMKIYQTPEEFRSTQSQCEFLRHKEFTNDEINQLLTIEYNERAQAIFQERWPSTKKWQLFLKLLRHYAITKIIASDVFGEHEYIQKLMREGPEDLFYAELFDYVFRKDYRLIFHAHIA